MVAILYHWKIKSGMEKQFRDAWLLLTQIIYSNCGSLGSRLHLADDGTFYAYAQWPSFEARESSEIPNTAEAKEALERMNSAVEERFPSIKLKIDESYLKDQVAKP